MEMGETIRGLIIQSIATAQAWAVQMIQNFKNKNRMDRLIIQNHFLISGF